MPGIGYLTSCLCTCFSIFLKILFILLGIIYHRALILAETSWNGLHPQADVLWVSLLLDIFK